MGAKDDSRRQRWIIAAIKNAFQVHLGPPEWHRAIFSRSAFVKYLACARSACLRCVSLVLCFSLHFCVFLNGFAFFFVALALSESVGRWAQIAPAAAATASSAAAVAAASRNRFFFGSFACLL